MMGVAWLRISRRTGPDWARADRCRFRGCASCRELRGWVPCVTSRRRDALESRLGALDFYAAGREAG